jgi:hypothetical protein
MAAMLIYIFALQLLHERLNYGLPVLDPRLLDLRH